MSSMNVICEFVFDMNKYFYWIFLSAKKKPESNSNEVINILKLLIF